MPRVPLAQQDVNLDVPTVPVAGEVTPVPEAFGIETVKAGQKLGATVQGVLGEAQQHLTNERFWNEQAQMYDDKEKMRQQLDDILVSTETQKIKDSTGAEYDVPVGVLNRTGFAAKGSSEEYYKKAHALKTTYLSKYTDPQIAREAARNLDSLFAVGYNKVKKHESRQITEATSNAFLNSAINDSKQAGGIDNIDALKSSLDSIKGAYLRYGAYKGLDPETIQKGLEPWIAKTVNNAAINTIIKTNDLEKAKEIIDSAKEDLSPDDYNNIVKAVTERKLNIDSENRRLVADKHDEIKAGLEDALLHDQLTEDILLEAEKIPLELGGLKKTEIAVLKKALYSKNEKEFKEIIKEKQGETKAALQDALLNETLTEEMINDMANITPEEGGLKPTEIEMFKKALAGQEEHRLKALEKEYTAAEEYVDLVERFVDNAVDARAAKSMIIDAYKDGIIDKKEAQMLDSLKSILKDTEWNKSDNLFVNSVKGIKDFFGKKNKSNPDLAMALHNLVTKVNSGKNPITAVEEVKKSERLKKYPWMATLPAEGSVRIMPDGSKVKCFPDGRVEEVK